jgi:two-component system NtrC family sensor kinase
MASHLLFFSWGNLRMTAERRCTTDARRACILVVDDEPLVAALMADTLGLEGYETARNGREALKKIAGRSYDLILSDLQMPELDGVGLYRELEQQHPRLLPRLAFVSGSTEVPEYASFCERTAVSVLGKPFSVGDLHRLVQRCIQSVGLSNDG